MTSNNDGVTGRLDSLEPCWPLDDIRSQGQQTFFLSLSNGATAGLGEVLEWKILTRYYTCLQQEGSDFEGPLVTEQKCGSSDIQVMGFYNIQSAVFIFGPANADVVMAQGQAGGLTMLPPHKTDSIQYLSTEMWGILPVQLYADGANTPLQFQIRHIGNDNLCITLNNQPEATFGTTQDVQLMPCTFAENQMFFSSDVQGGVTRNFVSMVPVRPDGIEQMCLDWSPASTLTVQVRLCQPGVSDIVEQEISALPAIEDDGTLNLRFDNSDCLHRYGWWRQNAGNAVDRRAL